MEQHENAYYIEEKSQIYNETVRFKLPIFSSLGFYSVCFLLCLFIFRTMRFVPYGHCSFHCFLSIFSKVP